MFFIGLETKPHLIPEPSLYLSYMLYKQEKILQKNAVMDDKG